MVKYKIVFGVSRKTHILLKDRNRLMFRSERSEFSRFLSVNLNAPVE